MYVFLTADPQSNLYVWSKTDDAGAWRIDDKGRVYIASNPSISDLAGNLDDVLHAIWSFEKVRKDPIPHGVLLAKVIGLPIDGKQLSYRIEKALGTIDYLPSYPTLRDVYNYWTAKYPLSVLHKNPSRTSTENRMLLLWGDSYVDQI